VVHHSTGIESAVAVVEPGAAVAHMVSRIVDRILPGAHAELRNGGKPLLERLAEAVLVFAERMVAGVQQRVLADGEPAEPEAGLLAEPGAGGRGRQVLAEA